MNRSVDKILTTHVGSLPDIVPLTADATADTLRAAVAAIVTRQKLIGLDVINEGEVTKGGDWLSYVDERFGGFEERPADGGKPLIQKGKDRDDFAEFYRYATEKGTLFYLPGMQIKQSRPIRVCTSPITYRGQDSLATEIDLLRSLAPEGETFLTSTAPASIEVYRRNEFYKSEEEFVFALAEAMRVEYETIANAGLILQVDDAWLPALCAARRTRERHGGCRLRFRRAFTSPDCLGKTGIAGARRRTGQPRTLVTQSTERGWAAAPPPPPARPCGFPRVRVSAPGRFRQG